jgi:curved DNA-binding protein
MNQNSYVDYYEDLQISSNADQETIERVYRLLAKRYHPDNSITGNNEKFNIITTAYKVLSDSDKRAAFDGKNEGVRNQKLKTLSKVSSSEGIEDDQQIRHEILSILYMDRRKNPSDSGVGSWSLEKLWYLKEKIWIQRVDNGGYAITANGVEIVEEDDFILGKDRLLTDQRGSSKYGDEEDA